MFRLYNITFMTLFIKFEQFTIFSGINYKLAMQLYQKNYLTKNDAKIYMFM